MTTKSSSGHAPLSAPGVLLLSLGQPHFDGRLARLQACWTALGYSCRRLGPLHGWAGGFLPGAARRLSGLLSQLRGFAPARIAWVHACDAETLPLAWLLARWHGARLLYDAHEDFSGAACRWQGISESIFASQASRRATVNARLAAWLSQRLNRPVAVLANQLTRTEIRAAAAWDRDAGRRRRGISPDALVLVYSGGLFPGRGLEVLPVLASALPAGWQLLVKGFGPLEGFLAASHAAKSGRLRLEAACSPLELAASLADADIGLLPYPPERPGNRFSLAGKCFEYAAAGLAVLASPLPVVAEFLQGTGIGCTLPDWRPETVIPLAWKLQADLATIRRRGQDFSRKNCLEVSLAELIGVPPPSISASDG